MGCISRSYKIWVHSGKFTAKAARPRGLEQIFGSLLPFRVLSAMGVEVSAHQLIPRVGF